MTWTLHSSVLCCWQNCFHTLFHLRATIWEIFIPILLTRLLKLRELRYLCRSLSQEILRLHLHSLASVGDLLKSTDPISNFTISYCRTLWGATWVGKLSPMFLLLSITTTPAVIQDIRCVKGFFAHNQFCGTSWASRSFAQIGHFPSIECHIPQVKGPALQDCTPTPSASDANPMSRLLLQASDQLRHKSEVLTLCV